MKLMRSDTLIGALGALVIWAVYFVAVYSLQGLGCVEGWQFAGGAVNPLTAAMVALTAVALAAIAWNGRNAWRAFTRAGTDDTQAADRRERARFLGLLGVWVATLSFIATVYAAIPILMLDPCAA